jgi:hypothetical protein
LGIKEASWILGYSTLHAAMEDCMEYILWTLGLAHLSVGIRRLRHAKSWKFSEVIGRCFDALAHISLGVLYTVYGLAVAASAVSL